MIRATIRFATMMLVSGATIAAGCQTATSAEFGAAPTVSWPTYNGDYSGRRFSELTQLNESTAKDLTLRWTYGIGRNSSGSRNELASAAIKSTPLVMDGKLYFTVPDHVFAVDSRTGKELWTYSWADKGGHILGNRGLGFITELSISSDQMGG